MAPRYVEETPLPLLQYACTIILLHSINKLHSDAQTSDKVMHRWTECFQIVETRLILQMHSLPLLGQHSESGVTQNVSELLELVLCHLCAKQG